MNDNLDQLPDAELSEVFAVEVAGYPEPLEKDRHGEPLMRTIQFATSADAVLPWLYRRHWDVNQTGHADKPIRVRLDHANGPFGESDSFPRAACIALIRAKRAQKT